MLNNKRIVVTGAASGIAPVVAFLCHDSSAWIKGVNLPVDGGLSAYMADKIHGLSRAR